jgi:hypothetical protein
MYDIHENCSAMFVRRCRAFLIYGKNPKTNNIKKSKLKLNYAVIVALNLNKSKKLN